MDNIFKALSDPTRREILFLLRENSMTAGEIARHFALAKPTLTAHFSVLSHAGLIQGEKSGTRITYCLNLFVLKNGLKTFLENLEPGGIPSDGAPRAQHFVDPMSKPSTLR